MSTDKTKLKFVKDGILINEMQSKRKKQKDKIAGYDLIIIDEAHERTTNIDFLLGYLKSALQNKNIKTKLLIMSATLHVDKFVEFFRCPLITIHHKSHNMEYFYLKTDCDDYIPICISTVTSIIRKEPNGDILVFFPGQEEIERVYFTLVDLFMSYKIEVLKLFSTMSPEEQDLIFKKGNRKVILCTNIAETSITIENIGFVFDCGKFKAKYYSISTGVDSLDIFDISKAQAKQRAGRAGRTQPGVIYRIYSYEKYLAMLENPIPEILRCKLHSVVLSMKVLGIDNIDRFNFIDRPSKKCISQAELYLFYIRAIDDKGLITSFGKRIAQIPLSPEISVSLFAAKDIGCLRDVAAISAFLEFPSPFLIIRPESPDYKRYKDVVASFIDPRGSFYTFLLIFRAWQTTKFSIRFLKSNYLNVKILTQILSIRNQLKGMFPDCYDSNFDIERAFCAGFFMNTDKISEKTYKTLFGDIECHLHPKDELAREKTKYVIYYEIYNSKQKYMRHCLTRTYL